MCGRATLLGSMLVWLLAPTGAGAEAVAGSDQMLCTAQHISFCAPFEGCQSGAPVDWNVPDFLVADVRAKTLSTTAGNERPRSSAIEHVRSEHGVYYLQGVENQRAYSITIKQETGEMAAAIVTPGANISVYGICTPLPVAAATALEEK